MVSVFDLEKLRGLLRDFYEITRIRITVFDENRNELVSCPAQLAPFCQLVRSCEEGKDACDICDKNACETAKKRRKTYIYQCHAGLTEAVTPLYVDEVFVGYLWFGHVFSYADPETGWGAVRERCKHFPIDIGKLEQACKKQPLISHQYVQSATQILHAVASYLILERMATLREDMLAVRLDAYLSQHFTEELKVPQICAHLEIGRTQLYKLSQQMYGRGIAEHIRHLRMELAKTMLLDQRGLPIAEIAAKCGYNDYNYFISVFTREVGLPPGAYRKVHT